MSNPPTIEATISRCKNGHDVWCITLNDFRLFGGKCCGRWTIVRKYKTTLAELRNDLSEAVPGLWPQLSEDEVGVVAAGAIALEACGATDAVKTIGKLLDAAVKP